MKYIIGIDFGTLSARAVLVDAEGGNEICEATSQYPHGVLDKALPSGKPLKPGTALQVPSDYIKALKDTLSAVISAANIDPCDVIGLGIDFTSSTVIPISPDGTPLSESEEFSDEPHAYVKLWKHRTADKEAEMLTSVAKKSGEKWISCYGGKLSAELALPKILETRAQAPKVYDAAYRFMDVGDWLTLILTGKEVRSPAFAGFKFLYTKESGYPKNEFFASLTPSLDGIIGTKIPSEVAPTIAMRAGELSERGSEITGLPVGTALSLPMIDAHASLAGLNVTGDGEMVIIIGTSSCHIINSINKTDVSGIFGYAKDAVFPGLYTYEAGQCAVGDMFDWYVKNALPASYEREAEALGIGAHKLLREKAKKLEIGESGIVALDWWSGNRSILADSTLKGMIYGLTMATKPEEIYRALLESVTFGARVILEQFESQGVKIGKINAAGGIAKKDDLLMQIYADVLDKDIYIAESSQSAALGSAVYAAAAAGIYPSIEAAAKKFAKAPQKVYHPIRENVKKYDALYKKYRALHDHFAKNKI